MKQIIKRITAGILFFAIFFAIIMYAGIIGRPYYGDSYNFNSWQYFYSEDDDSLNVIAIGSSALYRFWIPPLAYEEQGFTSFIIGHSSQLFGTVPYIIEEAAKTQSPDLIVVEVRSFLNERRYEIIDHYYTEPAYESWNLGIVASGMKYSSTRFNMIHELYVDTEGDCEFNWHFPILKYHSIEYRLPLLRRVDRIVAEKDELKSTLLYPGVEPYDFYTERELVGDFYLTEEDKALLDRVVSAAEKSGAQILFVATPNILNDVKSSMLLSLQMYIDEKGYDYIDLNNYYEEIGLDSKVDFYDYAHTNVVGAEKVTTYLAEYIAENYELDNVTLNEKQKKEWANACSEYSKLSAKLKIEWQKNCESALAAYELSASDAASPTDLAE